MAEFIPEPVEAFVPEPVEDFVPEPVVAMTQEPIQPEGSALGAIKDYGQGAIAAFSDVGYSTLEGGAALLGQITGDSDLARSVSDLRSYSKNFYAGDVPDDVKEKLSYKVTEAMAQLPAYMASGAAKVPGLLALGVNAFQQGRDDYLQTMGVTSATATEEQLSEANKTGAITAVPLMVLERFGAGKLLSSVFKDGGKVTAGEAVKRTLGAMAAEGATEGTQTLMQNAIAGKLMGYDPDREIDQNVYEAILIGTIASGGIAGPTNATMVAANKLSGGIQQGEINPVEMAAPDQDPDGNQTLEGGLKKTIWDNPENIPIVGSSKPKNVGFIANLKELSNNVIEPISAQMKKLSPRLAGELRRLESSVGTRTNQRVDLAKPFVDRLAKLQKKDNAAYAQVTQMLFNGENQDIAQRDAKLKELGMLEEFQDVRAVLDEIYKDAESVGMKSGQNKQYFMGYVQEHFPRMVQDYEGLKSHYGLKDDLTLFEQEIAAREKETGSQISENERGILLESFIKGDMHQRIGSPRPQSTKGRVKDVVEPGALPFYMQPEKSLIKYIENMTTATETKKFLGINDMLTETGRERVPGRMAAVLQEEYNNKTMTADKERRIRNLVKARFGAKDAQNQIIGGVKNLGYLATMGNVGSAMTQIGDFAYTAIQNGILPSIRAATGEKVFRLTDIGIDKDQVTIEAQDGAKAFHKAVDFVFKASGLTQLDRFAKEVNINAKYRIAQKQAGSKKEKLLRGEAAMLMNKQEVDQFIAELKTDKKTELIGLYLFNQISEIAPVSLSEMPPMYAAHPNWRIMYQLKSYTVKQFNFMREQAFAKIYDGVANKNPKLALQGMKNLVMMGTVMMAANATADVLKDFIFGREINADEIWLDNVLRLFGLNRYVTRKFQRDPANALMGFFAPPQVNIANDIWKDAQGARDIDDLRTMKYVPLVGKFYYWHEGRGREMENKYKWQD